jgi:GNAT superfamily N-acetyltransferase
MQIQSPLSLSIEELAEGMTSCFEGYIVPAHFTAPLLASMIRAESIDLATSLVALDEGKVMAAALVARRGKIARVAAMGVATVVRRQGLGRQILTQAIDEARKRGESEMVLEVIEQNPTAIALYEGLGFVIKHRLLGFKATLSSELLLGPELEEIEPIEVADVLRSRGPDAASWSMSATTVANMAMPSMGVRFGDVYAAIGPPVDNRVSCRSLAFKDGPDLKKAKGMLQALATRFPDHQFWMPAFFPEHEYKDALVGAGMELDTISQYQMALSLS